ncbi:hypothetical protein AB406_0266 [Riemerella anatipestifer]|uniref:Uncharacterized protein n=1 Tax=Riemerella anatipestifer TaxID=34085 RepID=A0A1S7DQ48_RIEAN|nr:hypothetical protein AB406_0266 [Riemerella anatipestifer]
MDFPHPLSPAMAIIFPFSKLQLKLVKIERSEWYEKDRFFISKNIRAKVRIFTFGDEVIVGF